MGEYARAGEALDASGIRLAIVAGRFNEHVTRRLLDGAASALRDAGADPDAVPVHWVPGAFEIPLTAKRLALSGGVDVVVCLGAVIRGETPHFDYVAGECAAGLMRAGLETGVPLVFGVLTTDDEEQALARAGGPVGNKGAEAVHTGVEMVRLLRRIDEDAARAVGPARSRTATRTEGNR
jgi:6,7-dimethyl-8-ribityllumazine synthase